MIFKLPRQLDKLRIYLQRTKIGLFFSWINHWDDQIFYLRHNFKCRIKSEKRRENPNDPEYFKLKKYKDVHTGKRCFIVATGPSLLVSDVDRLKKEYTFSMNSIIKLFDQTDWRPTYYAILDDNVYKSIRNEKNFIDIPDKFIADTLVDRKLISRSDNIILFPIEVVTPMGLRTKTVLPPFSDDIYSVVYDMATVTYSILQIAVYMGFKKIYLLGVDCDYSGEKQHFVDFGKRIVISSEKAMISAYKSAKKYADAHGIKIYNATRGGKLEVFERVDFDTLFKINTEDEDGTKDSQ